MTDRLFGWCSAAAGCKPDQHHNLCRREYRTQVGVTMRCSCPNHANDEAGAHMQQGFPATGGGRIGVQVNGPERGVGTSGRGLIDATEERQL